MNIFGKIAFIGAGNMVESIIKGLLSSEMADASTLYVTNRSNAEKLENMKKSWGVKASYNKEAILRDAQVVVLGVKPQDMKNTLEEIKHLLTKDQLIISTAAGLSLGWFEQHLGKGYALVRTMANLPCQVKAGATAVTMGKETKAAHRYVVDALFSALGMVVHVNEDMIDAITGLSGSGPAYVYLMISAMADAGVQSGLSQEVSFQLAVQTVFGAAKLVKESGFDSQKLVQLTSSRGGTTLAGLQALENGGFSQAVGSAVKMATLRSKELSLAF